MPKYDEFQLDIQNSKIVKDEEMVLYGPKTRYDCAKTKRESICRCVS